MTRWVADYRGLGVEAFIVSTLRHGLPRVPVKVLCALESEETAPKPRYKEMHVSVLQHRMRRGVTQKYCSGMYTHVEQNGWSA